MSHMMAKDTALELVLSGLKARLCHGLAAEQGNHLNFSRPQLPTLCCG